MRRCPLCGLDAIGSHGFGACVESPSTPPPRQARQARRPTRNGTRVHAHLTAEIIAQIDAEATRLECSRSAILRMAWGWAREKLRKS